MLKRFRGTYARVYLWTGRSARANSLREGRSILYRSEFSDVRRFVSYASQIEHKQLQDKLNAIDPVKGKVGQVSESPFETSAVE